MDELVHDLVSALEQTSEQNNLGHLWKEMVLSPLRRQRRQIRRRRDRKRRCNPSLHLLQLRRCLSAASDSSLDEGAKDCRGSSTRAPSTTTTTTTTTTASVSAANYSDSDDMVVTHRWHSFTRDPVRSRQHSWPESDSFTEGTPGRPLRRRRKVKRMTSDVMFRLQRTLKVSGVEGEAAFRHRSSSKKKQQRLSGMKKGVSAGWSRANVNLQAEGVGLLATECWKDKIILEAQEQRDASDESMSEGETSSICSSDPGLFTNDEGRQGDDEQSDWFFEGDCGAGPSVAGLMPGWDSDSSLGLEGERPPSRRTFLQPARPSQRGIQARLNQLPGVSGRCIRKGCRRILTKGNSMPMFVDRMKHLSHNPYQRDFRALSYGNRERSQFNSLRSLPVYPIDMGPGNCHRGCSSSVCRNRQTNVHVGLLCTRDIKRRRKTSSLSTRMSARLGFVFLCLWSLVPPVHSDLSYTAWTYRRCPACKSSAWPHQPTPWYFTGLLGDARVHTDYCLLTRVHAFYYCTHNYEGPCYKPHPCRLCCVVVTLVWHLMLLMPAGENFLFLFPRS